MLKNLVRLEVQVAEKIYHFICDPDSPIEHVKEAIFQLTSIVSNIEEKIKQDQKEKENKSEEQPKEPAKTEE